MARRIAAVSYIAYLYNWKGECWCQIHRADCRLCIFSGEVVDDDTRLTLDWLHLVEWSYEDIELVGPFDSFSDAVDWSYGRCGGVIRFFDCIYDCSVHRKGQASKSDWDSRLLEVFIPFLYYLSKLK